MVDIVYDTRFYLAVWQTIVLVLIAFVMAKSIQRYYEKKTKVAGQLSLAFIFFFIAIIFNTLTSWNGILSFIDTSNNKSFVGIFLWQAFNAQFAYDFLILGIYAIYQFSISLNRPDLEEKKPIDYIAIIGCCLIIIYGFVRAWTDGIPRPNDVIDILTQVDIYVVLLSLILIFPMLKTSFTLRMRLDKENKDRSRITFMFLMAVFLFLTILSFILETIYGLLITEANSSANIFSFFAWICVIVALFSAYFSFYRKSKSE